MQTANFVRLSMLVAILASSFAAAQEADPKAAEAPKAPEALTVEQLQDRLKKLEEEIASESASVDKQAQRYAAELTELKQKRQSWANRILNAQIEREQNVRKLEALRKTAEQETEAAAKVVKDAEAIPSALREAAERLRIHLKEIPGSEAAQKRLADSALALEFSAKQPPDEKVKQSLANLLAEFDNAHEEAVTVRVAPTQLYTAKGNREDVKLLSIGHARFAYLTDKDKRVGLALASPREASGYRWSEDLKSADQALVRSAIAEVEGSKGGFAALPADPLGKIQAGGSAQETGLWATIKSGGPVMVPLFAVAFLAIGLIVERLRVLYQGNPDPTQLAGEVLSACRAGRIDEAHSKCKTAPGAVARVLDACLVRYPGQRAMEDGIQEQLLHEIPQLQRFMGGLAVLAGVAPLLGLLGTVTGIIDTFDVICAFGNANPAMLAGGISEALITTAAGLIIAVPILVIHSFLRGRSDQIVADAERYAAAVLITLVHAKPVAGSRERPRPDAQRPVKESVR